MIWYCVAPGYLLSMRHLTLVAQKFDSDKLELNGDPFPIVEGVDSGSDLWILPLSGDQKPYPFLQTNATEVQGKFSPNGKWIAYTSNESGTYQVYVRSFPSGSQWQISDNGGGDPKWRRDGKELFFISSDRKLTSVEVRGDGPTFESSVPRALFEMRIRGLPGPRNYYDVTRDGQRFLVASTPEEVATQPMTVVLNWQADQKH